MKLNLKKYAVTRYPYFMFNIVVGLMIGGFMLIPCSIGRVDSVTVCHFLDKYFPLP
jgi:hypothetical protein